MKYDNKGLNNKNTIKKIKKIERTKLLISESIDIFRCPICKESIKNSENNSIKCKNNHCFDISKKGYINLINNNYKTIYDKSLFESRNSIYNSKLYDKLTEEIISIVHEYTKNRLKNYILDTGCGEGYYLNNLCE